MNSTNVPWLFTSWKACAPLPYFSISQKCTVLFLYWVKTLTTYPLYYNMLYWKQTNSANLMANVEFVKNVWFCCFSFLSFNVMYICYLGGNFSYGTDASVAVLLVKTNIFCCYYKSVIELLSGWPMNIFWGHFLWVTTVSHVIISATRSQVLLDLECSYISFVTGEWKMKSSLFYWYDAYYYFVFESWIFKLKMYMRMTSLLFKAQRKTKMKI